MAERVGQQLGNYQLLRLLGRGTFAEVYLAEHRYLEVPAAIKVLHVRMEPDTHAHFLREARTIAHLQHPHIIRVHDFGFQDQTPFLVMEYTPNGTLRTRHPKGTRLPLEQIVQYVKQIAPALDYAHQQRVIHRDIKPENMLLSANNEIVLSDFGIAVVQQSMDSLSTQSQAGTPVYMAPEQIQRKPCAASDQYALGVLVYEWLCGEPPFRGSLFEVLSQHLYHPPPSLCARIPSLPPAVEDEVFGALAKEPHARFASVQDFAEVLEAVCEATQTLVLRVSSERLSRVQSSPHEALAASVPVPSPQEQAGSSSTTQPLVLTREHTADKEESVALEVLPTAAQIHAPSQRERVPVSRTNRQRFLRKVRAYWIAGVLEHSLHGAALLALGLQEQPDAVANPWQLVLQHPAGAPHPLPTGTRVTEVYDAAEGELLILGAPGSGKSTLLLELARDLLERAEHDEHHPLPVVFNLSSWASKQQPLSDWLVEELSRTYQVPHKLGKAWVVAEQILPLLDGLDEVATKDRTACIETINTYRQEHGLLPLVVCSRSVDYLAQAARIRLGSAVAVQPLTQQQVDDYLASGGEPLRALRVALQQDASLHELTSTPLMLSILTLTYHGMSVEDLLRGGIAPTRQQIFEHYVEHMLARRGGKAQYRPEQTVRRLTWLARQMRQHNQTVFFIEQMQPDWLQLGKHSHQFLLQSVIRFICRIIVGLLSGVVIGVLLGLISGLLLGLVSIILSGAVFDPSDTGYYGLSLSHGGTPVLISVIECIAIAVVIVGLFGGLASGLKREIHPVEIVAWSWKGIQRRWRYWLTGMLVGGLILFTVSSSVVSGGGRDSSGAVYMYRHTLPLIFKLIIGLSGGLMGGLIGGLLGGVSRTTLDAHARVRPNQGIWRSLQNGTLFGGLSGVLVVLIVVPLSGWIFGQLYDQASQWRAGQALILANSYSLGLNVGLLIALSIGLIYGGVACLQHLNLRFLLWSTKRIPWNYPRFLDYATEHILLRKVGGSYIFVHRLLLEYFASLDTIPPFAEARAQTQKVQPIP